MINTDKHKGHKGQYFNGKLVDNYLNMQLELKRLREGLQEIIDDFETQKTDLWTMRNRIETILKGEE